MFNFSVLDQKKKQNLMREGVKKTFKKKTTLNLFLEKLTRAKTLNTFLKNVNERDEIKF